MERLAMKRLLRLLPLCVAACTSATDAAGPTIVSAELAVAGPLVQALTLELASVSAVEVEYWTEGSPRLVVRSAPAISHRLELTRLRPAATYRYEIGGTGEGGSFLTESLPDDLAQIRFTASGTPTVPLVLLHVSTEAAFHGYVIVDASGAVVWYARNADFPFGATRRGNGNFVFMDRVTGLREVTPAGEVVAELAQDLTSREMHHDVIATPANSLLFLAFDTREWNGATLKGEAIWEWWPDGGQVEKRWTSWDHLSPEWDRGRIGVEWLHANSLSIGPRGNVLVSVHYLDQVISIARGWEEIEWRLGGVNATISVPGDARFSGQHTAAEVAPNRVLLFDNGTARAGPSRALELDISGSEASRIWAWGATPDNYAFAVSSARRLSNGNTLVAFGMRDQLIGSYGGTEVYEVTAADEPVWHLRVEGVSVQYRAEPIWSIGGEEG
jgi:hypothetical protein